MTTTSVPTLEFDHHAPCASHRRGDVLAQVRDHPVFWTESNGGHWVVASHEMVKRVLRDPATFSSLKTDDMQGGDTIPTVIGPRLLPAEVDPPLHRTLRLILTPKFHRRAVDAILPEMEKFIIEVIQDVAAKGEFDIVHDIADRIPAGLMATYLGFPPDNRVPFIRMVHAALELMPHAADPDFGSTPETQEGLAAFERGIATIRSAIADRRVNPTDDLVSHLVAPEFDLDDDTVQWLVFTLIVGGAENPAAMISNSLLYLSQDTALRDRLAADPELIPTACEELLRYTSAAVSLARTATEDVELGGVTIREGDRVLVWLPGANHDPRVFDRPDEVNINRNTHSHVAFGDGPHVCIGALLFRVWFKIMMREILTTMPNYTIDEQSAVRFDDAATMYGWRTMPAKTSCSNLAGAESWAP